MIIQSEKASFSRKNEYEFTEADFQDIAKFAGVNFGLHLPDSKMPLVYSRVAKRLRILGVSSFRSYREILNDPEAKSERLELLSALTTNVTHFFREAHHFEILHEKVLPDLIERANRGGRVRLWSAGCSTGMEAYSIAITLLDACPKASDLDVKILATDIDPLVVQTGKAGIYEAVDLAPLTSEQKKRYTNKIPNQPTKLQMSKVARGLISFGVLNLMENLPFSGKFDVVFCRNVAIYFTQETQEVVWQKFNSVLDDNSFLFVGHSERLSGPALTDFQSAGITTYKKTSPSSSEKGRV